uniref:hypothetical chloroplast RF20 n=1 Tax=Streptofilum capillatum TaxID=2058781 RepID=UPI002869F8F0|nr:hypothetical chloroplast RF20 [Streptofilum capillatum]WKT08563.1 hypothetical chloroplast RF20 [Streptofilum capillatum]WKT08662.1 hypothetical chloroplast RF20 [Streptofilum sp. BC4-VF8pt]WKT08761.1 hypothetical chloroplast RF20 [Streptofilum sp. ZNP2-VF4pt]
MAKTRLFKLFLQIDFLFSSSKNISRFQCYILFLLLGFFQATALSTTLGQTGDWDVLIAGFLVAIMEIMGFFAYKPYLLFFSNNLTKRGLGLDRPRPYLLKCVNYFKIGLMYGLFVDAFKLGS